MIHMTTGLFLAGRDWLQCHKAYPWPQAALAATPAIASPTAQPLQQPALAAPVAAAIAQPLQQPGQAATWHIFF